MQIIKKDNIYKVYDDTNLFFFGIFAGRRTNYYHGYIKFNNYSGEYEFYPTINMISCSWSFMQRLYNKMIDLGLNTPYSKVRR